MTNIWFTADTHFGHHNIIRFTNRPFLSTREMDETLIDNWNKVVGVKDLVYHLGDFSWGNSRVYREQLNGRIVMIYGSHDKECRKNPQWFEELSPLMTIRIDNQFIVLCHYAMRVWDHSHYGAWMLYGHSHGRLPSYGKSYDVGVDNNNYYPISYEQVQNIMKLKEENKDLVKK